MTTKPKSMERAARPPANWFEGFEVREFDVGGTTIFARFGGNALSYLHASLGGLGGTGLGHIEPAALAEYERCFTPEAIHGTCEDYRASAGIDLVHDRESRERGGVIGCDTHVLWAGRSVVNTFFQPLVLWQAQSAGVVSGAALPSGHFVPETLPQEIARSLAEFFGKARTA